MQHGAAAPGELVHQLLDDLRRRDVEPRQRLIEDQQLGVGEQRGADRDLLQHTFAEGDHRFLASLEDAKTVEQALGALTDGAVVQVEQAAFEEQELPGRQRVMEPGDLGEVADQSPGARVAERVDVVDLDGAGVRSQQSNEALHGRRLARAVGAEQRQDLSWADGQVQPVEGCELSVGLAQGRDHQHVDILAEAARSGQRGVTRGGSGLRNRAASGIFVDCSCARFRCSCRSCSTASPFRSR